MGGSNEHVANFCAQWNLNSDAERKLMTLSPELQALAMQSWDPHEVAADCTGKFIMFVSGIEKTHKIKGKGSKGCGKWGAGAAGVDWSGNELDAFCARWALNADARAKLQGLTHSVRTRVMNEYKPNPDITEHNGKVIMFAASVQKAAGKGSDWVSSGHSCLRILCHQRRVIVGRRILFRQRRVIVGQRMLFHQQWHRTILGPFRREYLFFPMLTLKHFALAGT